MNELTLVGAICSVVVTGIVGWLFLPVSLRLAWAWIWLITQPAPLAARVEKRARMQEYLHDLVTSAKAEQHAPREIAPQVLWATLRGIPGDVGWLIEVVNDRAVPIQVTEQPPTPEIESTIKEVVQAGLGRLSHNQRVVLILRYFEQLSITEIAEVLGTSENHVEDLQGDALRALREQLQPPASPSSTNHR